MLWSRLIYYHAYLFFCDYFALSEKTSMAGLLKVFLESFFFFTLNEVAF